MSFFLFDTANHLLLHRIHWTQPRRDVIIPYSQNEDNPPIIPDAPYQPTDRRPIASRNLRVMQSLASFLVRWKVSENAISIAGIIFAIVGGFAFAATANVPDWQRWCWLTAALMIQLRLLANLLDGMVAIESGQASPVGELFNEVPDRVSDAAILIGAGYALGGDPILGYIAACAALFTAYVRAIGKAAGAANEYCGPMAKQQRMFIMTMVAVFHGLTPTDWNIRFGEPPTWGVVAAGLVIVIVGSAVTSALRLLRIANTLRKPK